MVRKRIAFAPSLRGAAARPCDEHNPSAPGGGPPKPAVATTAEVRDTCGAGGGGAQLAMAATDGEAPHLSSIQGNQGGPPSRLSATGQGRLSIGTPLSGRKRAASSQLEMQPHPYFR